MKTKFLPAILLCTALLIFSKPGFSQVLQLGALEQFTLYTGDGAVTNSGTSVFTGNIGSNLGIISGFDAPTTMTGSIHNADAVTQQARIDLLNVYIHLNDLPVTNTHAAAFGSESITPGVYAIPGAGSVGGLLILDGQGDPNAAFVIKFEGAMTVGAGAVVVLSNGTLACNVFWIAEGSIAMGATVTMKGTLIAHPGAVSMGTGGDLEGRMISMAGAVTFGPGSAIKPTCLANIPITCITSCVNNTLGTAAGFTLFAGEGAVANTGISGVIGNIGSDFGAVSGWESSVVIGTFYNADATTAQAKLDLQSAYNELFNTPATSTTHTPVFGNGETLTPGVYSIAAAGSMAGEIILDGQGDPNARFIFKFGAAFTVGAKSKVTLINGARRCNIFWIAEGAISIAAFSIMKGNFIASNGAIDMGANGFLEGRLFSTKGAVGFNSSTGYISYSLCSTTILPVGLFSFSGVCENQHALLKWRTPTGSSNSPYIVERSPDGIDWNVAGAVTSTPLHSYSFSDDLTPNADYYYRIKQADANNDFKYSNTILVKSCGPGEGGELSVFPNPTTGRVMLLLTGDQRQVSSTEVFNPQGVSVYRSGTLQAKIDLSSYPAGIYLVRVIAGTKIITRRIVVKK